MTMKRLSWAAAAALLIVLSAGCEKQVQSDNKVDATYEALFGQFRACASTAAACLKTANCDEAQNQVCRDQFATCRDAAKAAAEAFYAAVRECRSDARACKADASDSDDGGERHACHDELRMCVASSKPERAPAPPCIAELRDCIQADMSEPRACMMTAHQCFLDSMPPRCDGDGGVVDGGWDIGRGDRGGNHGDGRGDNDGRGDGHGDNDGRGDGDGRGDHDKGDGGRDTPPGSSTDAGSSTGTGP